MMSRVLVIFLAVICVSACGPNQGVEECVANGVAYFKEIGSYPTLSSAPDTGRRAEDVARERCNRSCLKTHLAQENRASR